MPQEKDKRYKIVRDLIAGSFVKNFNQIFDAVPKSVVYRDLGMNYNRFNKLLQHVDLFTFREIKAIAGLIGCDAKVLIDLVYSDMTSKKKK